MTKDGTQKMLDITAKVVRIQGATRLYTFHDITELSHVKEQLQTSLTEREILLKEVYHRVKNNFNMVSSLLYLQAEEAAESATKEALEASMRRIQSMATIHERLYHSDNLAQIDFGEFASSLSAELCHAYHISIARVRLHLDTASVFLTAEQAIPCALLLNELVSNALKYAFPDEKHGDLHVTLRETPDGEICLRVSDTGIGLPDDLDVKTVSSLGFQLVTGFVQQLQGTLTITREHGTAFCIRFSRQENRKNRQKRERE